MATDSTTRHQPSGFGTLMWALFYFFAFTIIVVVWVSNSGPKGGYEDRRGEERLKLREKIVSDAKLKLNTTGLLDPDKGIVHMPIADAKRVTIAELRGKKVGPSQVKVDPWLPLPPPFDPNAAEPPPPAMVAAPQGADTVRFVPRATPEPAPGSAPAPTVPAPAPTAPAPAAPAPTAPAPTAPAPTAPAPTAPAPTAPAPAAPAPAAPATPAPGTPATPAPGAPATPAPANPATPPAK